MGNTRPHQLHWGDMYTHFDTHKHIFAHTCAHIFIYIDHDDYGFLSNFHLGPFKNDVHQLSFNVSVVDDDIPEDTELFRISLAIVPADRARLGNRVTVSPDVGTVTIQDNDRKLSLTLILVYYKPSINTVAVKKTCRNDCC